MRLWKLRLALAAATVLALAVTVFVRRGVVETLLMILIGGALVGMYLLRRYARAVLLYRRHAERRPRPPRTEPVRSADLVEATRDELLPGASLQCR